MPSPVLLRTSVGACSRHSRRHKVHRGARGHVEPAESGSPIAVARLLGNADHAQPLAGGVENTDAAVGSHPDIPAFISLQAVAAALGEYLAVGDRSISGNIVYPKH